MDILVEALSENDIIGIMSCLNQFVKKYELPKDEFYVIMVWKHDVANEYFKSNTPTL